MPTHQGTVGAGGASTNRAHQARYSVTVLRLFAELRHALSATPTFGLLSLGHKWVRDGHRFPRLLSGWIRARFTSHPCLGCLSSGTVFSRNGLPAAFHQRRNPQRGRDGDRIFKAGHYLGTLIPSLFNSRAVSVPCSLVSNRNTTQLPSPKSTTNDNFLCGLCHTLQLLTIERRPARS